MYRGSRTYKQALQNDVLLQFLIVQSLSKEELRRVLEAAHSSRRRDWLMILVAYWHGLRASEVVAITRDDIQSGYLTVPRLKGSNRTVQPLVEHSEPLLNERAAIFDYMDGMHSNQKLFPISRVQFWRLFQSYCERAAIPEHLRHPHILKHSIGMHSIEKAGIENVRQHLGHKSISSTGAYLKVDDQQASAAVERAVRGD